MCGPEDSFSAETATPRQRGAPQKYARITALELINNIAATDWNQVAKSTMTSPVRIPKQGVRDVSASLSRSLWAYMQPQAGGSTSAGFRKQNMAQQREASASAPSIRNRERVTRSSTLRAAAAARANSGLEMLFSKSNAKSHLFSFEEECTNLKIKRTLDNCDLGAEIKRMESDYSSTTLEDCEHFSPYYAASVGSDISSDMEDSKQLVSDGAQLGLSKSPLELLRYKCERFFDHHGLVVKVRKLPVPGGVRKTMDSVESGETRNVLLYPAYHFVTRQRTHMFEQLMRGRTFLDTRYNSCNEIRNSKSPFSLIEPHDEIMKRIESVREDLCNPDFSGIYISVSTKAFESDSEFGRVRRCKTIAWALIELSKSNERCLKSLWVNPTISAPATTTLLRALLPFAIVTSFFHAASDLDERYPVKGFKTWLSDVDTFPRQALILLASFDRFGLVKHFCPQSDGSTSRVPSSKSEFKLSHVDVGITDRGCYCHGKANWENLDCVFLGCTEQLVNALIHKWEKLIPEDKSDELVEDVERVMSPEAICYNQVKTKDSHSVVRDAEFAGLSALQVKDILASLYGHRWRNRLKTSAVKSVREQSITMICKQEAMAALDEREERRKRRALYVSQA